MNLIEIGRIHSPFKQATGTPIQPSRAGGAEGYIEIASPYSAALKDLEGFDRVWLIYWFHRASAAKLKVIPFANTQEYSGSDLSYPAIPDVPNGACKK